MANAATPGYSGTPLARKLGIRAGDIITHIEDEEIKEDASTDDVVKKLRGPKGTQVHITLRRTGLDEPLRMAGLHLPRAHLLQTTGETGVPAVHLLVELAPGQPDLLGIRDDHEVAGVQVRDVTGTVFAREHHRDARGESPQHLVRRIHDVPVMPDILDGNHGRTRGHQNPSKIFQSWTREAEGGASGTEIAPSKGRVRIRKQVGGVKCPLGQAGARARPFR